jgi:erythrin-vacuolar iron transport family protein
MSAAATSAPASSESAKSFLLQRVLIPQYRAALIVAVVVIVFELLTLSWIRARFFSTGFLRSFLSVALGGAIIASVSAALGGAAG